MHILLADDDAVDRELLFEAMNHTGINYKAKEVSNGVEVFELLNENGYVPDVIILDLNMPVKDGRQTLLELKSDIKYKHIPVFILSTSSAPFDVTTAYNSGANLFLVKPHGFNEMIEMLTNILTLLHKYISLPK